MQFTVTINQVKALEWGLNAQQALLFAFVYSAPSWAAPVEQDGATFYALSKAKIIEELPLLTDKADTAYRMLKALAAAGLIVLSSSKDALVFALTDKGREWDPATCREHSLYVAPARPRRRSEKKPIPQAIRAFVFERDGYACLRCGCDEARRLRADHVVPESQGGLATPENLQTLCMSCNSWKGVKTIDFRMAGGAA